MDCFIVCQHPVLKRRPTLFILVPLQGTDFKLNILKIAIIYLDIDLLKFVVLAIGRPL